ncbi:hypothetical protein DXG01_009976, partial [Tephrocybe rancida]
MASIFLDETSSSFSLGPSTHSDGPPLSSNVFMGGTALPLAGGSVSLVFQGETGTSASFFGEIGSTSWTTDFTELDVMIDGKTASTNISSLGVTGSFYKTPTLSEGLHNVTIYTFSNVVYDYMVVTAGNHTLLAGERLILDDVDEAFVYDGTWTRNQTTLVGTTQTRQPYGSSMHQSTSEGASAVLSFTGTSIAVYGVSNSGPGPVTVSFTMDGQSLVKDFHALGAQDSNFVWYSNDLLPAGTHDLKIELTRSSGGAFTMDYAMYAPSFTSLAMKSSTGATNTTTTSSGSATPTSESGSPSSSRHATPVGAIVGGVVGALLVILCILAFLLYRRRRSHQRALLGSVDAFPPPVHHETGLPVMQQSFVRTKPALLGGRVSRNDSSNGEAGAPTPSSGNSRREVFVQRKTPISRQESSGDTHVGSSGEEEENPRVQELVVELQRELARTASPPSNFARIREKSVRGHIAERIVNAYNESFRGTLVQ